MILGHVSATLVDLAQRGFLDIEEVDGSPGPDWRVADLRHQVAGQRLLPFEVALLDGMFARQSVVLLSEIDSALVPALDRFRTLLRRDAVRNGRLRRWRRDKRTPEGERLLGQIQEFRRELRALAASSSLVSASQPSTACWWQCTWLSTSRPCSGGGCQPGVCAVSSSARVSV